MSFDNEILLALQPVVEHFAKNNIAYHIGGSVASSFHGASRSTVDVDIVVELDAASAKNLVASLGDNYYGSEPAAVDAVKRKSCFNLIHLATSFKIDIFVSKGRAFDKKAMSRAVLDQLVEGTFATKIASVEDIILAKLEWYRLGNELSERQWDDLSRVAKLYQERLDRQYLETTAGELGVGDLLKRLLDQL